MDLCSIVRAFVDGDIAGGLIQTDEFCAVIGDGNRLLLIAFFITSLTECEQQVSISVLGEKTALPGIQKGVYSVWPQGDINDRRWPSIV